MKQIDYIHFNLFIKFIYIVSFRKSFREYLIFFIIKYLSFKKLENFSSYHV